jgi:hypothetical protein
MTAVIRDFKYYFSRSNNQRGKAAEKQEKPEQIGVFTACRVVELRHSRITCVKINQAVIRITKKTGGCLKVLRQKGGNLQPVLPEPGF